MGAVRRPQLSELQSAIPQLRQIPWLFSHRDPYAANPDQLRSVHSHRVDGHLAGRRQANEPGVSQYAQEAERQNEKYPLSLRR